MIQNNFKVDVVKTCKIEVDDNSHTLPPHLGCFSEFKVADYFCPEEWSNDGVFIEVHEEEALWFDFRNGMNEYAILPAVQRINPITGEPANLEAGLAKDPKQNYLVMPRQLWLDGYAKDGKVYQFRITKQGIGLAVEDYVLPKHMRGSHALGFAFFEPVNPRQQQVIPQIQHIHHYPDLNYWNGNYPYGTQNIRLKNILRSSGDTIGSTSFCNAIQSDLNSLEEDASDLREDFDKAAMGAGGRIQQQIITDTNSVDYYKDKPSAIMTIYMCLPDQFKQIMKKGRRQDAKRKDRYILSGEIGGMQIPLMK